MRLAGIGLGALALVVLHAGPGQTGDDKDARAVIDKALTAHGGEANLAKFKAVTFKGAGTFFGLGEGIPYNGEWHFQGEKQSRFTIEIKVGDQAIRLTQVVNGNKGWSKLNDELKDLPKEEIEEEKHGIYAQWISNLHPLKDKGFKLASVGEAQVNDKPALGVRVSREGKRDVNLFFDKTSGLLVKYEHQVKDVKGGGNKEMNEEVFLHDYKDFQGVKLSVKMVIRRDGKPFVDATMSEVQPQEKLDEALFTKP
ncbi:MAG: hypothetical protein L0Y72_26505 [Gemmataceae bacterium]|nr:hypothetical protein [Gemmataceae bacterium]